eukprot:1112029_1
MRFTRIYLGFHTDIYSAYVEQVRNLLNILFLCASNVNWRQEKLLSDEVAGLKHLDNMVPSWTSRYFTPNCVDILPHHSVRWVLYAFSLIFAGSWYYCYYYSFCFMAEERSYGPALDIMFVTVPTSLFIIFGTGAIVFGFDIK